MNAHDSPWFRHIARAVVVSDMARLAQSLRKAREREARAVLPPGLTMQGMPLAVPEEPMLQAWRPTS